MMQSKNNRQHKGAPHGQAMIGAAVAGMIAMLSASQGLAQVQGPSTLQTPYVLPVAPGVVTLSVASNGNSSANAPDETFARTGGGAPYRLVGIPDGMGAYNNADGQTFTLLVNHELGATVGIPRAHGTAGSFVSKWIIDKNTKAVISASDLITNVAPVAGGAAPFGRFCSADLAAPGAYFNASTSTGTQERIYLHGEEIGAEGRNFGTVVSGPNAGTTHFLPAMGKFSWENSVAAPLSGNKTVVWSYDDSTPGEVYLYVGDKQNTGNEIDRAGLNNGKTFGLVVPGVPTESRTTGIGGTSTAFTLTDLSTSQTGTGAAFQTASSAAGVTQFLRPEDGHWDPSNPAVNYFVTTDRFDSTKNGTGTQVGRSRLWRTTLNDMNNPTGGNIEMLMDGTEAHQMLDNMTTVLGVDGQTRLLLQEDPGGVSHSARIWLYDPQTDALSEMAKFDAARFGDVGIDAVAPFNQDEESSGIIDARDTLGLGWFMVNVQSHYQQSLVGSPHAAELVEGGQLIAMYIPQAVGVPEPTAAAALAGVAGAALLRRRRNLK
ncbi:MAG: DUF839 domain-containing protein [Anaerolineae bacterium]|nr:DUF839 domain-containing protein [Phycisphaerae bacterium]